MRVVLRHAGIGLYYAGRKHWVGSCDSALDLETIKRATKLSLDEAFEEMEIAVIYDAPRRELVFPVPRKTATADESLRDAA